MDMCSLGSLGGMCRPLGGAVYDMCSTRIFYCRRSVQARQLEPTLLQNPVMPLTHTHACMHTYMHAHMPAIIHTNIHTCIHSCIHQSIHTCISVWKARLIAEELIAIRLWTGPNFYEYNRVLRGTQFTCFTGTKVQIMTRISLRAGPREQRPLHYYAPCALQVVADGLIH